MVKPPVKKLVSPKLLLKTSHSSLNKETMKPPVEDAIVAQEQEVVTETPEKSQDEATPPPAEPEEE